VQRYCFFLISANKFTLFCDFLLILMFSPPLCSVDYYFAMLRSFLIGFLPEFSYKESGKEFAIALNNRLSEKLVREQSAD